MSDTPIVLTKQAATQIREALADAESAKTKLASDLQAAKAQVVAAEKVAAAKPDLSKVAGDLADRMLKQKLIGAQFRDKTAENLADPVKLAGYFQKALDLLSKQAAEAEAAPRRIGVPAGKTAGVVDSKSKLADADRSFERAIGL